MLAAACLAEQSLSGQTPHIGQTADQQSAAHTGIVCATHVAQLTQMAAGQGSSGTADASAVSVAVAKATADAIAEAVAKASNSKCPCLLLSKFGIPCCSHVPLKSQEVAGSSLFPLMSTPGPLHLLPDSPSNVPQPLLPFSAACLCTANASDMWLCLHWSCLPCWSGFYGQRCSHCPLEMLTLGGCLSTLPCPAVAYGLTSIIVLALPCPALPCPALPCPARPCPALPG